MDTQVLMAWLVFGIMVCNVLVLACITILAIKMMHLANRIENQSGPAINSARASLEKVETLARSTEEMVRQSVQPVLSNVKDTSHAVSQSAEGVRRIVGRFEDAVAKPIKLLTAAGNALETPAGKAGLLALGFGVARYAAKTRAHPVHRESEPISVSRTNGASASAS